MAIPALMLAVGLAAQSSTGSGSSGSGSSGTSGAAGQGQAGAAGQSTPSTATPAATGEGSTVPGNSDNGSNFTSPRIQPGDYLAPLSVMRWGPFSLNSIDSQASWSNQPLGLNGDLNNVGQNTNIPRQGPSIGSHSSASFSARWRWGTGFVGLEYTPSMDYQTAVGSRQINHNVSMFIDHPFRFGKWRLTLGVHSATVNQYSQFYQPPLIEPLLQLEIPITTRDLLGLLTDPSPLQPVTPQLLLVSTRVFSSNATAALSRPLNGRDTFTVSTSFSQNRYLDFGNGSGALFNYPKSTGFTTSASLDHGLSARMGIGISVRDAQSIAGAFGNTSQQSIQGSFRWQPWRSFAFSVSAGPSRVVGYGFGSALQAAGSASISYTIPKGGVIAATISQGFDLEGFSGGQNSRRLSINYGQSPLHRAGRLGAWRYQLTTSVQLSGSTVDYNNQGAALGSGVGANMSLSRAVTRQLSFVTNYGYFFQNISNATNMGLLAHFQRNLVSAGLHYSFGLQGAPRY